MLDDTVMRVYYERSLENYAQFYDHPLGRKFQALTNGTKLDQAAGILCGTWKAASNTMRLPWLSIASIDQMGLDAAIDTTAKRTFLVKLSAVLQQNLSMPKELALELDALVHKVGQEFVNAEKATKKTFNRQLLWESFLDLKKDDGSPVVEFPMAVWGSQQIGYSAAYHAYENFLRKVIKLLIVKESGKPGYRIYYDGRVQRDVARLIGQSISDQCIDDPAIKLAKEIRNSLAHEGGFVEVDPATPNEYQGFVVIDSIVQVTASKNRQLFLLLQERAHLFAEAALKKLV